jgi:hypothetical protein
MAFDLSWLWNTLNAIVSTIQSWFSSLWQFAQNIVNTGQGIFSGLVAFGSQLWDAITKAFSTLGEWFYNALKWIWQGLCGLGSTLGSWLSTAYTWLASGIQWVASGIWGFGNWIYNGLKFVWNWIVNTAKAIWKAITSFFSGIATAIGTWWSNVVSIINSWFTNLVTSIRNKLVQTIIADVSIYFGWKSMERLISAKNIKDATFSMLGLVGSPLVGYLFGSIINGLIPTPATTQIQWIPEIPMFTYTPPSLEVETPAEPTPPPAIPTPPAYGYYPVTETTISIDAPELTYRWDVGQDKTLSLDAPTFETEVR